MKRPASLSLIAALALAALGGACHRDSGVAGIAADTGPAPFPFPGAASFVKYPAQEQARSGAAGHEMSGSGYDAPAEAAPASPVAKALGMKVRATSLKLIWTASMNIEVADYKKAVEAAAQAVVSSGGYVSDRQSNEGSAGHQSGTITLRVPSDRFDGAMTSLQKIGRVVSENVRTQDVSKEYADLETRLKVKRETASRLREILIRQTGKVAEVLEVEREIGRVVEEIEQAEGERRYFDNLISLSTITLALHEPDSIVTPGALDPLIWALRQSARTMSESLANLLLVSAGLLPWLMALYFIFRIARWRWSRRAIKAASASRLQ